MYKHTILSKRVKLFDNKVKICNRYSRMFERGELPPSEYWNFLIAIEEVIANYWRYIKRYYKIFKKVNLLMPVEGYKRAKADGLINDADVWLEYIKDVNIILNIKDSVYKEKMLYEFLEIYRKKICLTFEYMYSEENQNMTQVSEDIERECLAKPLILADNKPVYSSSEIGITDISYNYLLETFKKHPSVKNVWLHGSRLHGENTYCADIDLIADCPAEEEIKIKKDIEDLPIPYSCDMSSIYKVSSELFIKIVMISGTKKIYCSDDFNTHWNPQVQKSSLSVDISSVIKNKV